ncbi:MAG: ERCC4 domain-containing protein [Halodesulfurarchaeum sp.]
MVQGTPEYVEHPLLEPDVIESRPYQAALVDAARSEHTLVSLPTGLGKTAVSLQVTALRLHEREDAKSLLLAPTKPLVEQHATFYRRALSIPDEEIVVFTGETRPEDRADLFERARVVVATPQVVENDLVGNRISLSPVVHCTFDECHRATGNYPYTYIAERYHADASDPLVTGMSASPGDDEESILQVCRNLGITNVAVKTESDPDVAEYTYDTEVEWIGVELPDTVLEIRDALESVIQDRLETLSDLGVTTTTSTDLSQSDLNEIRARLQRLIDDGESAGFEGMSLHAEVMKVRRAVELVETQSVDALRRYFERQRNAARSSGASKATQRFVSDSRVKKAMRLAEEFDDLHPKFRRTRMLLAETLGIEGGDRVIVFTESRDTAEALTDFLGEHFDVRRFVGQGDRDGSEGMTQREQQETLEAFRSGEFDVLVSTSVAEEGLDVPEVDLVLFFEPVPTAIRSVQRKGRTGRQTEGRVVVLMAEDTRDEAFFWISRRREQEMEDELRTLKDVADELEVALQGEQAAVESFTADGESAESPAAETSAESPAAETQAGEPDSPENRSGVDEASDVSKAESEERNGDSDTRDTSNTIDNSGIADTSGPGDTVETDARENTSDSNRIDGTGGNEEVNTDKESEKAETHDSTGDRERNRDGEQGKDDSSEDEAENTKPSGSSSNWKRDASDGHGLTGANDRQVDLADFGTARTTGGEEESPAEVPEGSDERVPPPDRDGPVEIVIDQRELDSSIARDLSTREGVETRLETLEVGDYILSDRVAVERKTVEDFLSTLLDGGRSLFEQAGDLSSQYGRPVLVLEGEADLYSERNVHPNAIRGALASLVVDFGISVLETDDETGTADVLEAIATREQDAGDRDVRVHGEKSTKTLAEQQEYVVSSIADIGPVTARSLLDALGSVEAVMTAEQEELLEVNGVGEVTANRIREVVGSDYEPE